MFGKLKLDKADTVFSQYIRLRDKQCMRCRTQVDLNMKGLPINLQASHYFGRGKETTRFDEENVDALCGGCHQYWGSVDRESYRAFKIKQLGQKRFDALTLRANTTGKKDRNLAHLYWKERLKGILLTNVINGDAELGRD